MLFKNVAGQHIHIYAYDSTTGDAKTGDANNITGYVSLDGTANAIDDTNPTEVDATNMPGIYAFDLAQAETNCNSIAFAFKSSTENIRIEPVIGFTTGAAVTQTGDSYAIVNSETYGNSALKTLMDTTGIKIATNSDKTGYALTSAYDAAKTAGTSTLTAQQVWEYATRTLSAFGFNVTVGTNSDKTGYSLTATPPTAVEIRQEMDSNSTKLANLDATVSSRSTLALGAKMDIIDAPNATAITAIQSGLSKPGTAQTITAPADMALNSTVAKDATVAKAVDLALIPTNITDARDHIEAATIKADIRKINNTTITGTGAEGDLWGPA